MLLSLHYNSDESYLYEKNTEVCNFMANDNISWYNFCLGGVSKDFTKDKQSEVSWNGTANDFPVDYNSIKKEDILNIRQWLIR